MIKNIFKFLLLSLLILFSHNISHAQTNIDPNYSKNIKMIEPFDKARYNTGDTVPIKWIVNNSDNVDGRLGIEIVDLDSKKTFFVKYVCSSKDLVWNNLCSDIVTYPSLDGQVRLYNWKIPEYIPTGNYQIFLKHYDKKDGLKNDYGNYVVFKIVNNNPPSKLESSLEIDGLIKTKGILLGQDVAFDFIINGGPTINNKKVLVNFVDVNDKTAITSKTIDPAIPSTSWTLTTNIPIRIIDPKLVNGTYNVYVSLYEGDEESAIKNFINRKNDSGYKNIRTVTVGSRSEDIILAVENAKDKIISEDYNYQFFSVFRGNATKVSYKVFVQLVDSKGKIVFQNDFTPTPPTYQWKGGDYPVIRKYSFSKSIPAGEYKVLTGLQDGSKKIKLYTYGIQGIISNPDNTYQIATLQLGKSTNNTSTNNQQSSNLSILPIDFKNSDKGNYAPHITYRGGQFKFNLNFAGGPTDLDYKINVKLYNESTSKVDFEKDITPDTPTSKWSSNTSIPVVIDIPTDYKASVWAPYRVVVSLRRPDKVLILNNKSEILKSLSGNDVPFSGYYNSINTAYLNNGNYIVSRFLIANSNIHTLPSENPQKVAVGSDFPITLKFLAKNPEWTYDGIICVGNFFSNNHTTALKRNKKHNPVIIFIPVNSDWSKNASFGISNVTTYSTEKFANIPDSDTWRGDISIPVKFKIPNDTKPGKYEIHVIPAISSPFCSISAIPMEGTSISMLEGQFFPSNFVGRVEITSSSESTKQEPITINKWKLYNPVAVGSIPSVPVSTSNKLSTITFGINFVGGPTDGDKRVFVHFVDSSGNIKFLADVAPSTPSSKWTANSSNWITSEVDIPENIDLGNYNIYAGLYSMDTAVKLNKGAGVTDAGQLRYNVGMINISKPITFIDVYKKLATGNLFDALTTLINY